MLRPAPALIAAVMAAVSLTIACGDSDDSDSTPTSASSPQAHATASEAESIAPCSLVTREQAEAVLGFAVDEPRLNEDGSACVYEETDPNGLGGTVLVSQTDGFEFFDAFAGEPEEITGLGDEALYYPDALALVVKKGSVFISIELRTSNNAPDDLEVATGFAEHALAALP